MKEERIHAYISGRVQGVGFRAATRRKAQSLRIKGWVKNLPDGRVETIAEGSSKAIENFIDFLHRGSSAARVENVKVEREKYKGDFKKFQIKY